MENSQTNIDQLIKQKFDHFEAPPPEHIWSGVKAGIVAPPAPSFFALYGKKIAVAAIFLVAVTAGLWYLFTGNNTNVEQATNRITQQDPSSNTSQDSQTNNTSISDPNTNDELSTDVTTNDSQGSNVDVKEDKSLTTNSSSEQNTQNVNSGDRTQNTGENNQTNVDKKGKAKNNSDVTSSNNKSSGATALAVKKLPGDRNNSGTTDGKANNSTDQKEQKQATKDDGTLAASSNSNSSSARSFEGLEVNTIGFLASQNIDIIEEPKPVIAPQSFGSQLSIAQDVKPKYGHWSFGLYFSPEVILNDFDSVTIEPTYSLGIEPTYFINKHWFVRFGIGASYSRDRGFATVDYMSNDLVGSYEDVYDISFDTIDGEIVPTFYTSTTEIWEDINHIQIRELTNKYMYLQMPALFGYYHQKSKLKWYIYGGPAINLMISKQIDEPTAGIKYDSIIDLNNKLPERSPYYMQLWLGGGVEYQIGKNLGLAIEPSYRYYFNHVYKESAYKTALSGFSLRFGLVYTIR